MPLLEASLKSYTSGPVAVIVQWKSTRLMIQRLRDQIPFSPFFLFRSLMRTELLIRSLWEVHLYLLCENYLAALHVQRSETGSLSNKID